MSLPAIWLSYLNNQDWLEELKEQSGSQSADEQVDFAIRFLRRFVRTNRVAGLDELTDYLEQLQIEYPDYIEWSDIIIQLGEKSQFLFYVRKYFDRSTLPSFIRHILTVANAAGNQRLITVLTWLKIVIRRKQVMEAFVDATYDSFAEQEGEILSIIIDTYQLRPSSFDYDVNSPVGRWLLRHH